MNRINKFTNATMRSPLIWGAILSFGLYLPLESGYLENEYLKRYLAGHWMEYVEVCMFFVGLSALALKYFGVQGQFATLDQPMLGPTSPGSQSVSDCPALLERLSELPNDVRSTYLVRRLEEIVATIGRKGSAASLDAEMKYLADLDASRASHSYGFVRIVIWALPILGLLGTVVGITLVIANLSPQHLEESLPAVTAGLSVAFDTTAVALALSMVLMFTQYFVDRTESRLLTEVDARVSAELLGRFQESDRVERREPESARQMSALLSRSTESLIARQTELWRGTIDVAHKRWQQISASTGDQLEQALASAVGKGLREHASQLAAAEQQMADQNRKEWEKLQRTLQETASTIVEQQRELSRQGEVLARVVEATGQVAALENTLNQNLRALAGAKHFEETVISLAAAVQLLSARLQAGTGDIRPVELNRGKRVGQAA